MPSSYDAYDKECERILKINKMLLSEFKKWLQAKKLSQKTIHKHLANVDFYINDFLLYDDANEAETGVGSVNMFLGYWFIKKAMWASVTSIKDNANSLKKFYTFLYEKGRIEKEDLDDLKMIIKENMEEWLATLRRYDNPDIEDMDEVWGF